MAFIQTVLEIPDDVHLRVLAGEYVRDGGVVRDQLGRLVKLLDDGGSLDDPHESLQSVAAKAVAHPRATLLGAGAVTLVAAGGAIYWVARKRKTGEASPPVAVRRLNASLSAYLEAAQGGQLSSNVLERLIEDLDAAMEESAAGPIHLELPPEEVAMLVGIVAGYTRELAEANHLDIVELRSPSADGSAGTVTDLREYLEIQRRIIDDAA